MPEQLSLIDPPTYRRSDPAPSRLAAEAVGRRASALHNEILDCFDQFHRLTDEQLESLPCFGHLAPSTVRKRRSELFQRGRLVADGTQENSRGRVMTRWKIAGTP